MKIQVDSRDGHIKNNPTIKQSDNPTEKPAFLKQIGHRYGGERQNNL